MKANDFFQYREEISLNGIFLTFNGALTHSFMVQMGEILKMRMSLFNVDKSLGTKIFSTVIEQAENITCYSGERLPVPALGGKMVGVGTITVGMEENHYSVTCGNMIPNEKIEKLKNKLTTIQKMEQDELKQYYKKQRRAEPDLDSASTGLGFIEIARKVCRPMEFSFTPVDDQNSFFAFKAIV
jgi:hydroxymethylpyrimidine pyrophosphatase-like HAD family hydrolase